MGSGNTIQDLQEVMNTTNPIIQVLNHGELWKTNLLLLNEEGGGLKDVKFIGMRV